MAASECIGRALRFSHPFRCQYGEAAAAEGQAARCPLRKKKGLKVWFDKDDLKLGEGWQPQNEQAIEKKKATAFTSTCFVQRRFGSRRAWRLTCPALVTPGTRYLYFA
jgi:hypothetical protein